MGVSDGNTAPAWPTDEQLDAVRKRVAQMSQKSTGEVNVVACPYRICPLGAHIDHQGGVITAMTINCGVLLGFVPSENGVEGLDSSGLSSSAAVGIAYLLALEYANNIIIPPLENINLDKLIENNYLALENGILDQSAILLSRSGYLTFMDCKTKQPSYTRFAEQNKNTHLSGELGFKILLAFSGIRHNLPKKCGYNTKVAECKAAAHALLSAEDSENLEALLCNVDPSLYEVRKGILEENLAKRAEHYFSETKRVAKGRDAWAFGNLEDFGKLISESGQSSIDKYECGSKEMIQLYDILVKAPGVYGARFSGAGFRGCCLALVAADHADEAAEFVKTEYEKQQPELVSHIAHDKRVLVCEPDGAARIIFPEI